MTYYKKLKIYSLIIYNAVIIYINFLTDHYEKIKFNSFISLNKYLFLKDIKYILKIKYFKIININYEFSNIYNTIIFSYKFGFYDDKKNLIFPSDLTLYNNLHISCNIILIKNNINIDSLPNIYKNNYFECIELFNINEKIKIGFKIYQFNDNIKNVYIGLINEKKINYKNIIVKKDYIFNNSFIIQNYIKNFNKLKKNKSLRLQNAFIKYPICNLKRNVAKKENKWYFRNIYNHYFCFCKGNHCLNSNINQKCKYNFYLYIIDKNRNVYNKTDYLFMDFIFSELSSDDVYPVFERMEKQKFQVHYITENMSIYNKFCYKNIKCLTIIKARKKSYKINGDFLEKYLTLILKTKAVISNRGKNINYKSHNIFYNIEYITFICVGHGVSFFKNFLYSKHSTYGIENNDKLLIPPSNILISMAKKFGWKEENIIKLNLPRWDKYAEFQSSSLKKNNEGIKNNSILLMFTWRDMKRNNSISPYYFKNIINLLENKKLHEALKTNKVILYFNIHHLLHKYIDFYKNYYKNNKYIHFMEDIKISQCLAKIDLVVSDFSSIIFDLIYRKKPFIIYVPDAKDSNLRKIYKRNYYNLIKNLKNNKIAFENKYFELNETINKIIYYINNKFKLDYNLKKFYEKFKFRQDNSIQKFINYLKNLK